MEKSGRYKVGALIGDCMTFIGRTAIYCAALKYLFWG